MTRRKIIAIILAYVSVSSLSWLYAFVVFQQYGGNVSVTPPLAVFSDATCTTVYGAKLNFGNIPAGGFGNLAIYMEDVSPQVITADWNSTIASTTGNQLFDSWTILISGVSQALNGTALKPSTCYTTNYGLTMNGHLVHPGTYSWLVTLGYT